VNGSRLAPRILVALVLAACTGAKPSSVATPSSSIEATSQPASPAPTLAPTSAPTVAATPEDAQLPTAHQFNPLEPGRYAMPSWFRIPLSVELGAGWRSFREDKALQVNLVRGANAVGHGTLWFGPYAIPTADVGAFVAELRATPLMTFEEPVAVAFAGLQGDQFEARAEPNPAEPGSGDRVPGTVDIGAMRLLHSPGITDFSWYTESVAARLRFMFVEVGDDTLVIYLEAPPDEFDAFTNLAAGVLDTMLVHPRS
jgi:hypothetical protein